MTARRALVIGLDGMPLDLFRRLAADGVMPTAAGLLARGRSVELIAPVPEVSSTSWASFLTGANPAHHGIYGFVDFAPGGYDVFFPNVTNLRAPTLWDSAAAAGLRTLCLNVPGTYPAPEIDGVMVSGFVSPSFEKAITPARVIGPLRELDYELDVEVGDVRADPLAFIARVKRALLARCCGFEHLLDTEPWDLGITIITETDRLQHFLWKHVTDVDSPLHEACLDIYATVDTCLARLLAHVTDADAVALVADHGFGPADLQFHVNAWLREAGYLAPLPAKLSQLDGRSTAVALDPARIYLHRAGRFPNGPLGDAEAGRAAAELSERLLALRWDGGDTVTEGGPGRPVVDRVFTRDEVYEGPLLTGAPDLVVMPGPGVQLRGMFGAPKAVASDVFTGTHTRGNALFYLRGDGAVPDPLPMAGVAELVLAQLGAAHVGAPVGVG